MQCACAILSCVVCPTIFFHISHKRHFSGKKLLNTKYVLRFSTQVLSATFPILRRSERDVTTKVYRSACAVPLCVSDFKET